MVRSSSHGATGADAGSAPEEAERLTPSESPSELSPFAEAFVPQFEEVRAVLDRLTGFALVPVEVPSRDVSVSLAAYLALTGRRVHVVDSGTHWRMLPAAIVAKPPGSEGLALVVEPPYIDSDVRAALRLLNQRRDTVAERLGAPLLWCGSADFFRATAELAPDLWSVRELSLRIVVPPGFSKLVGVLDLPLSDNQTLSPDDSSNYRASQEEDDGTSADAFFSNATLAEQHRRARLLLFLTSQTDERTVDQRTMESAVEVLRKTTDTRDLARALEVAGSLAFGRGDGLTEEASLREAHGLFSQLNDRAGKTRCARALGYTLSMSQRTAEAEAWFGEALGLAREMDDWKEEAQSACGLAMLRLRSGDAVAAHALIDIARRRSDQLNDAFGLVTAHTLLSMVLALRADFEGARGEVAEALRLTAKTGFAEAQAQALCILAIVDIAQGRATEALVSLRRAAGLLFPAGRGRGLEECARVARTLPEDMTAERDALLADLEQQLASLRAGA